MLHFRSLLISSVALVALVACGNSGERSVEIDASGEKVGDARLAIAGGYEDTADTSTLGIINFDHEALCSGSLLAPNMVLTARHCVGPLAQEAPGGGVICSQTKAGAPWAPGGFGVTVAQDMFTATASEFFYVSEVLITPGDNKLCGNDLAILILKKNIPSDKAKALIPRVDGALIANQEYYAIGYGQTSDGAFDSAGLRRRRDELFVTCAETGCAGMSQFMTNKEWQGDTGICSGDSGGPALDLQNRVVGVTSRGGQNCSFPIYGAVHSWGEWIKESARHAADVGGYEAAAWANGGPTDPAYNGPVGGDCKENDCGTCWDGECTRLCGENAPCPDDYSCEEVQEGTSVCVPVESPADDGGDEDGSAVDDGSDEEGDGCSAAVAKDPTNPVPWAVVVGGVAVYMSTKRRRRSNKSRR